MSKVTVMVYTTLREKLGFSRKELEGRTVEELLLKLAAAGGKTVPGILFAENGAVRNHFVLALNSEIVDNGKTKKTKVKAGDVLHVFPPVSGG